MASSFAHGSSFAVPSTKQDSITFEPAPGTWYQQTLMMTLCGANVHMLGVKIFNEVVQWFSRSSVLKRMESPERV